MESRISIFGVLRLALDESLSNAKSIFIGLVVPIVLLICEQELFQLFLISGSGFWKSGLSEKGAPQFFIYLYLAFSFLLFIVINGCLFSIVAVSCHRIILLGKSSLSNRLGLFFSIREFKYFCWFFLFGLPAFAISFAVSFLYLNEFRSLLWSFGYLSIFITSIVMSRYGLLLPALAVGTHLSLRESIRLAKGNILRLAVALLVPQFIVKLIWFALIYLVPNARNGFFSYAIDAVFYYMFAFEVVVLSVAYRFLLANSDIFKNKYSGKIISS